MPEKIKNEKGEEIEVLTDKEVESLLEEEREKASKEARESTEKELRGELEKEHEKAMSEKDKKIEAMETELATAKEALDKEDQGTQDWAKARNQIKTLEGKLDQSNKERDSLKEEFSSQIRQVRTSVFQERIDGAIKNFSAGDDDVAEKIRHHYKRLGESDNEQEAMEKIKDAYLLATGNTAPDPVSVAMGASMGAPPQGGNDQQISQEVSELAKKMGISDEDVDKYSNKKDKK